MAEKDGEEGGLPMHLFLRQLHRDWCTCRWQQQIDRQSSRARPLWLVEVDGKRGNGIVETAIGWWLLAAGDGLVVLVVGARGVVTMVRVGIRRRQSIANEARLCALAEAEGRTGFPEEESGRGQNMTPGEIFGTPYLWIQLLTNQFPAASAVRFTNGIQ
ncbi:hypothetical protein PPACK8108_LOCUS10611 [Phakopsora pachyrhizi]|uniref:Uncharacterized protein n=1 Tax=Phakopsora pachyrhizi TaxID=170000 RepID=A0AAV0AYQ9_PHAPC|nr:hypothetical protein PPACK8108_LOCUS10611 [Phakopsora pachyrhizi]